MDFYVFIQKYFTLLIPGIVGIFIYYKLSPHNEQHFYFEIIKIALLSIVTFGISDSMFWFMNRICPCFIYKPIDILNFLSSNRTDIPKSNLMVSIVCAIICSFILTKNDSSNWIFRIANKVHITSRTNNHAVWDTSFDNNSVVVVRDFITGNTYYGNVNSFSDNSDIRELLLFDVRVYNEKSDFLYYAKQLYLARAYNEFNIEVFDYDKKEEETIGQQK